MKIVTGNGKKMHPALSSIILFAVAKSILPQEVRVFPIAVAAGLFYLWQTGTRVEKE